MKTLFLICLALSVQAPGFVWAATAAEKTLELNGSSWDVVLMTAGDLKKNVSGDIFTFQDGQFRSKNLMNRGFVDTHFVISLPGAPSNLTVWETMQTGKEGVIFLHGEWAQDKMWGTVTEQLEEGRKVVDHSFVTRKHWQPEPSKVISQVSVEEAPLEVANDQNNFLEEIRKFERAQAQAIKPAQ